MKPTREQLDDFIEAGLISENADGNFVVTALGEEFITLINHLSSQIDPTKFN